MAWYREMYASADPMRDEGYAESERSRADVDFVVAKLGLQPGAKVLDLCCGQGRHLLDLTRRGYDVVGVDLSEYMLGRCREAAAVSGIEPRLIHADMRELDFDSEFDAVINVFTSFGYLESDEEDQKVLDGISRALKPSGGFLIHLANRDWLMRNFRDRSWYSNTSGSVTLAERTFDPRTGREDTRETTIYPDGLRSERHVSIRLYTCTELTRMISQSGLTVESTWGGTDSSAFTMDSRRMVVLARKG